MLRLCFLSFLLTLSFRGELALRAFASSASLSVVPAVTTVPVVQGASASDLFTFTGNSSFQGNVTLTISGLPSGVSAAWSSDPVTLSGNIGSSTLSLSASAGATVASTSFSVTATGDGLTVVKTYQLHVLQAPGMTMKLSRTTLSMASMGTTTVALTATPIGGVTEAAGLAGTSPALVSGLPSGITSAWSSPSVASTGAVTWNLTLTGTPSAVASSGKLALAAQITDANTGMVYTAAGSLPLAVTLTPPTLSIAPALTRIPVVQGTSASDVFTVATGGSFQGNANLSVSGLPSGVTGTWSNSTVTPASGSGSSTLTLSATSAAKVSSVSFTVTATGSGLTVAKSYTVAIGQAPGILVGYSNASLSMSSMGSSTVTLTVTPIGGVVVPASLAGANATIVSGLPSGITPLWSAPTVASGKVSWTLTLTGTVNAVASSGTLIVATQLTDANTGLAYSANSSFPLKVSFTAPTLDFTPALTTLPVVQSTSAADLFTIKTGGSFQGNVTLSISALPLGVSAMWDNTTLTPAAGVSAATLTISANGTARVTSTTFKVTATGDGLSMTHSYTVQVQQQPAINLSLSRTSLTMQSVGVATMTLTASPLGGAKIPASMAGASSAVLSGLPAGFTGSWTPASYANGSISWTLTVTGSASAIATNSILSLGVQIVDASSGLPYSANLGIPMIVQLSSPKLSFAAAASQVPVIQGSTATDVFTITTGGAFQGNVSLTLSGLPSGVTATWSNSTLNLNSGSASATLTLSATAAAQVGSGGFMVTASGDGLTSSHNFSLQVQQGPAIAVKLSKSMISMPSSGTTSVVLTATPLGGVTVPANLSGASVAVVSGLPSGITPSWSTPTVAGGAVSWTLTLGGTPSAMGSNGSLVLSAQVTDANTGIHYSSSASAAISVSLSAPTLKITPAADHVPVLQGKSVTNVFTFTGGGSYQGAVTLSVAGLPAGVTPTWSSPTVPMNGNTGSSTLTLTATTAAQTNWFEFTVTATGDGLTTVQNCSVSVEPIAGVTIQISQPVLSITQQGTATLTVTADPLNGIAVLPNLAGTTASIVSSLPTGVTPSWSTPTVNASGVVSWTLTLSADTTAVAGNYPVGLNVQITDSGSSFVYSASPNVNLLISLLANVNIGTTPGRSISPTFMGLSHEWANAQAIMGSAQTGVNSIYRQLLTNLMAYGSGPINIRVGGNSTDVTGEPTQTTIQPFVELSNALGVQFELGVNLGANKVGLATDQATAYASQMPAGSLLAIELGNEPDLYSQNGWRSSSYTFANYYGDFNTFSQSILPVLPTGTKLMGPSWGFLTSVSNINNFMATGATGVSMISQHNYGTTIVSNPPMDTLLAPTAATAGPRAVVSEVALAHANGVPFRMGETGAMALGGVSGISDAFSAALWSVDSMFEYANVGVDGMNWEASVNYNNPFTFTTTTSHGVSTYALSSINPVYYGMLLFQSATPQGAEFLPVSLSTTANLKAWATVDGTGTPRLVIINKDETATGSVSVNLPGFTQAQVLRLSAPSYQSPNGITFGGQTMDGSQDGTIQGTQTVETYTSTNGTFQIPMPVTNAVLVTFPY